MQLKPRSTSSVQAGYKQTEVGVIPEDWEAEDIKQLTDVRDGTHDSPKYADNGVFFITSKNLINGRINFNNAPLISESDAIEIDKRSKVHEGDILISMIGTVGNAALVNFVPNFCIKNVALIKPYKSKVSSDYLIQLYRSKKYGEYIENKLDGGIQKFISLGVLRSTKIPLPPTKAEQEAIAGALSDADAWIESLEQLIAKKRRIKEGASQALLTGKQRLPGFTGDWEVKTVGEVILKSFCGPSPTCEEVNIQGNDEWGVLKTTAITWKDGWSWKKHKKLPTQYWGKTNIEIKYGDVLVTKAGPRHRVGVAAWVDFTPGHIIPSGKMICLRPKTGIILPMLLASGIASEDAQSFLDQRTTGMAESQLNYENKDLLDTPIQVPTKAEQTAIGEILSEMDAELDALAGKLSKARQIKQGMMQELLTGKTRLV